MNPEFVINKWKYQDAIPSTDFVYREPILAQRIAIFHSAGVRAKRKIESVLNVTEGIQDMLLNLVAEAREEKNYNMATRYLAMLSRQPLSKEIQVSFRGHDLRISQIRLTDSFHCVFHSSVRTSKTPN